MTYFLIIGEQFIYEDNFTKDGRLQPRKFKSLDEIQEYVSNLDGMLEGPITIKEVKNPKIILELYTL